MSIANITNNILRKIQEDVLRSRREKKKDVGYSQQKFIILFSLSSMTLKFSEIK